jgi:hypothetical protein
MVPNPGSSSDDPSFYLIRFKVSETIQEQVPLTFGDAVHNLRSALDHLACDLVRLNGGNDDDRAYFPISIKSEMAFENKLKVGNNNKINDACSPVLNAIRALRPYWEGSPGMLENEDEARPHPFSAERLDSGGNWGLAMLHELDIIDKHRLVIATGQLSTDNKSVVRPKGTLTLLLPLGESFQDREIIRRIKATKILVPGETLDLPFDVTLDERFGLGGYGLCPWLRRIADYIESLVKAFELLCFEGAAFRAPDMIRQKPPFIVTQQAEC